MAEKPKKYGWRPDIPDHRDRVFSISPANSKALPSKIDLSSNMPQPYDQKSIGSCTAQAVAAILEYSEKKQNKENPCTPSRLFIYYNERVLEGTVNYDTGATIRSGIKTIATLGYCEEILWPYNIKSFKTKPALAAYTDAKQCIVSSYERVPQTEWAVKSVLAEGHPVAFGFAVYDYFESPSMAASGILPLPGAGERQLGGHAVVLCGYDDSKKRFLVRNSWGTKWGQKGYFWMDYQYVLNINLSDDFWVVKLVPQKD
jgi:C1A family cysteine protease